MEFNDIVNMAFHKYNGVQSTPQDDFEELMYRQTTNSSDALRANAIKLMVLDETWSWIVDNELEYEDMRTDVKFEESGAKGNIKLRLTEDGWQIAVDVHKYIHVIEWADINPGSEIETQKVLMAINIADIAYMIGRYCVKQGLEEALSIDLESNITIVSESHEDEENPDQYTLDFDGVEIDPKSANTDVDSEAGD